MTSKYGCVLALLRTPPPFNKIKSIIDPNDLAEDGFEHDTHVTVSYGLHDTVTAKQVKEAIDGLYLKEVLITGMSLFENEGKDVLKLDVQKSKGLLFLREAVNQLPNTQTHPDYIPHVTIAYLKPGMGKKYLASKPFNYKMKVTEIIYSYPDRKKQIDLYESVRKY